MPDGFCSCGGAGVAPERRIAEDCRAGVADLDPPAVLKSMASLPADALRPPRSMPHYSGVPRPSCQAPSPRMPNTIRVLSTIAMRTVLDAAAPAFERAHGISVERVINSS